MVSRTYHVAGVVVATLLVLLVALGSGIVSFGAPDRAVGPGSVFAEATNNFDQVVVVAMENRNQDEVYGPAPYLTQLADQYGFAQHWRSLVNPSQVNYIGVISGSTWGLSGDGNHPNLNEQTIVDIIENSGHTWKAFAEDAGGSGCGTDPPRGEDHFPFLSFTTITGNAARCANLQPGRPADVLAAFNAGVNFIWLTPNDCNNMHSCSVTTGDNYIQSWAPGLLSAMAGKRAVFMVWYDEAYTPVPYIYLSFSGTAVKPAYKSTVEYSHYSLIKLIEDVWGGGNLGQGDVTANSPTEFFLPGGPDFGLSANPASVAFGPGQSATSMISMIASGGFTGIADLTATSVPAGVTTTCAPSSIDGSQTSTCTLSATNAGSYIITITGTSGTLVHTATIAATVTSPDFTLSANPRSVSFGTGQSATSTVSMTASGGFTGTVDLTATSTPSGVTTTCAPSSISGSETSTCTLSATTDGFYAITITGTSGTLVHTATIEASVAPPDFGVSANPNSVSFATGGSASSTISLSSKGGFSGDVDLTTDSQPPGVDAACAPSRVSGSQTSTCTFTGSTPGSYTVTVTGTNGSLVHTATIVVAVSSPDFSLAASPNSVSFVANDSATSTITWHSIGGFSDPISLDASSAPVGVTTSCSPPTLVRGVSSTCRLNSTAVGAYTVTITGTSGNLTRTTSIDVSVTSEPQSDFSLMADPSAVAFVAGQSASSTISLQSTGGFTGSVDLTTASVPSGVTISCAPSSIAGSETSTCTLSASATGSYTITITGTSGTLVHTATVSVEVTAPVPQADFSLAADPDTLSFNVSESGRSIISVIATDGFSGDVRLTAASSPEGLTMTCSPSSISGFGTATCITTGGTAGVFTVVVTGTSGPLVHNATISANVVQREPNRDTTPPEVEITFPSNSTVLPYANVTVKGSASDNVAIRTVELSTDNVTWTRTTGTSSWSGNITIQAGTTIIYARATDTAGNQETTQIQIFVQSAGGVPFTLPPGGSPLVVDTPIPLHLVAILFGVTSAVEACLFVWARAKTDEAISVRKPMAPRRRHP